jgi:hypothetical protein
MDHRAAALVVTLTAGFLPAVATSANVLRITPAPSLAGAPAVAVKGRSPTAFDRRIRFGDWQVNTRSKFDMRAQSVGAAVESPSTRKELALRENLGRFELEVTREGGMATQVRCETRTATGGKERTAGRRSDETSLTLPGYPRIDCTFGGAQPGSLALQAAPVTLFEAGQAELAGTRWQIRSVGKVVRLGYELLLGEQVVATVETASAGRVWMLPTLDASRQEEAAVLTGALLYCTAALELQDP